MVREGMPVLSVVNGVGGCAAEVSARSVLDEIVRDGARAMLAAAGAASPVPLRGAPATTSEDAQPEPDHPAERGSTQNEQPQWPGQVPE